VRTSAPEPHSPRRLHHLFSALATRASGIAGSAPAFAVALAVVLVWLLTGPIFHYSDTWQLVINTATTVVTFLMVFLLQHAQNKDTRALHLKLDELIAAVEGASNQLIDVEDLSEDELDRLQARFQRLAHHLAERAGEQRAKASVEEEPEPAETAVASEPRA
jgi:low affinity Fe/Cu permease